VPPTPHLSFSKHHEQLASSALRSGLLTKLWTVTVLRQGSTPITNRGLMRRWLFCRWHCTVWRAPASLRCSTPPPPVRRAAATRCTAHRMPASSFPPSAPLTAPIRCTMPPQWGESICVSLRSTDECSVSPPPPASWTVLEKFKIHRYDLRLASSCGGGL